MQVIVQRVMNRIDPTTINLKGISIDGALQKLASGEPGALQDVAGSFALVTHQGPFVHMARTLDRPMRYFLAKKADGPVLIVSDRIDDIRQALEEEGLGDQFHPAYTRMVPAHHILTLHLIGCPDPEPSLTRFFSPRRNALPMDHRAIGKAYISALADQIGSWLEQVPEQEPIGVCFSGGIDSGAVFLVTLHEMRRLGMNLARLKAFTLSGRGGEDVGQAREFLRRLDLELYLEEIEISDEDFDLDRVLCTIEDYKALDVEAASMSIALMAGIRRNYPQWAFLLDGDGGDENLKDYPIEENAELTIRSVLNNRLLYQEGWGVGSVKHSQVFSGGQSRASTRSYAPARMFGFRNFSPFMQRPVIEVAEGIPFIELTNYRHDALYDLKGAITGIGVEEVTGFEMPVFEKRRFQHGAVAQEHLVALLPGSERSWRARFFELYA